MKTKYFFTVLLTVLFLALIFPSVQAEEAFTIDERRVLQGMNRSWLQGYEPTISRNTMTFVLPILSSAATDSIDAQIILADESLSPFKLQTMQTKAQPSEDGLWNVRFTLNLHKDRRNGDYAAIIRITGKDKQGAVLQTEIPYVFHIRDGQPTREVIRLQVEQIESDLKVGEDGIITMTLTNPCKTVPFEQPVLDYHDLMKLTKILTRDHQADMENMFRRMCFNIFAHNRDDHAKNFTFIYEEGMQSWRLSPAYDLTYSTTYYGEHTTTVDGNGKNPGRKELLAVGTAAGLKKATCTKIIDQVEKTVKTMLSIYL